MAIVTAVSTLLLVFANAWAKRIGATGGDEATRVAAVKEPQDSTLNELIRTTRTTGEMLHGETQMLLRRQHSETHSRFDEFDRRLDIIERRHHDEMEELRALMRPPPGMTALLDKLP